MAKEVSRITFSKARIEYNEETKEFTIIETLKDSVNVYNLTNYLKDFSNIEGISLAMAKDEELLSEE